MFLRLVYSSSVHFSVLILNQTLCLVPVLETKYIYSSTNVGTCTLLECFHCMLLYIFILHLRGRCCSFYSTSGYIYLNLFTLHIKCFSYKMSHCYRLNHPTVYKVSVIMKYKESHLVSAGLYEWCQWNAAHDELRAGQPGEPACAAPERWLHRGGQALGHPHRQQDVVRETHRAGTASAPLPSAGRPQHLLWIQVRVTPIVTTSARIHQAHKVKVSSSVSPPPSGSVISWISPQVGLFVSPSTRLLPAGLTAASRTALSPKVTSPWYGTQTHTHTTELLPYICQYVTFFLFCGWFKKICNKIKLIPHGSPSRYVAVWKKRHKLWTSPSARTLQREKHTWCVLREQKVHEPG